MVGSGVPSVIHRVPSFPVRLFLNFLGGSLGRAPDLLAGMFDLVAGPIYGLVDLFARSLCRPLSFTGPDSEPQSDGQQQDGQFSRCFHDPLPKPWIFGLKKRCAAFVPVLAMDFTAQLFPATESSQSCAFSLSTSTSSCVDTRTSAAYCSAVAPQRVIRMFTCGIP
jgi:hypothetical protein